MLSQKKKKLDPVVTHSVLKAEFERFEARFEAKLDAKLDAKLQKHFQDFTLEITKGIQTMFDEQDRKNDEKFATKVELYFLSEKVSSLENKFDSLDRKVTQMYDLLVNFVGEMKTSRNEQVHNHDLRLTTIEKQLHLS